MSGYRFCARSNTARKICGLFSSRRTRSPRVGNVADSVVEAAVERTLRRTHGPRGNRVAVTAVGLMVLVSELGLFSSRRTRSPRVGNVADSVVEAAVQRTLRRTHGPRVGIVANNIYMLFPRPVHGIRMKKIRELVVSYFSNLFQTVMLKDT
jgi:hypothetical protein